VWRAETPVSLRQLILRLVAVPRASRSAHATTGRRASRRRISRPNHASLGGSRRSCWISWIGLVDRALNAVGTLDRLRCSDSRRASQTRSEACPRRSTCVSNPRRDLALGIGRADVVSALSQADRAYRRFGDDLLAVEVCRSILRLGPAVRWPWSLSLPAPGAESSPAPAWTISAETSDRRGRCRPLRACRRAPVALSPRSLRCRS